MTLSNTGNAPLTIDGVALAGDNPGDFAIATNACGVTLAAGGSCNIGITFKPTALGTRNAILRVPTTRTTSPAACRRYAHRRRQSESAGDGLGPSATPRLGRARR